MLSRDKRDRLLTLAIEAVEQIAATLPRLEGPELIDTAARLNALRLKAEAALNPDDGAKALLWTAAKGKPLEMPGGLFKAVLSIVPRDEIDSKRIREDAKEGNRRAAGIIRDYSVTREQKRVDFRPR
jgi:hypothetical protein